MGCRAVHTSSAASAQVLKAMNIQGDFFASSCCSWYYCTVIGVCQLQPIQLDFDPKFISHRVGVSGVEC